MELLRNQNWEKITLDQMDQVRLMNRTDKKYYLHLDQLNKVLELVQDHYYALDISGELLLPYYSIYYDTLDDKMYREHHNGKLNRFKIRRREYKISGHSFLEIKFKNNKGRTIKKRIASPMRFTGFSEEDKEFIRSITPFEPLQLKPDLLSEYNRLTLVSKNFNERCTIDFDLTFNTNGEDANLNQMAIIELKADRSSSASIMGRVLRDLRIKPAGFSKYCIGRSLLDEDLKRNSFKSKLRALNKLHGKIFQSIN